MKALTIFSSLLLISCAGPQWVEVGSGRFGHGDAMVLVGVGSVKGIANEDLAWKSADNRARAELAKQVGKFTAEIMRAVASEIAMVRKGKKKKPHDTPMAAIQFSRAVLQFVQISKHWRREKFYVSRAVLPIEILRKRALELKDVKKKTRKAIVRQIDAVIRKQSSTP